MKMKAKSVYYEAQHTKNKSKNENEHHETRNNGANKAKARKSVESKLSTEWLSRGVFRASANVCAYYVFFLCCCCWCFRCHRRHTDWKSLFSIFLFRSVVICSVG